jgi:hypothetical protein
MNTDITLRKDKIFKSKNSLYMFNVYFLFAAQDSTFSRQVKGHQDQRMPYGQAGDCYSKAECPQGRFSINLVGTNFVISALTRWEGKGSKPSKKIHWSEV